MPRHSNYYDDDGRLQLWIALKNIVLFKLDLDEDYEYDEENEGQDRMF